MKQNNKSAGLGKYWKGDETVSKQVYTAKDISEILGVSESKSYQYIRQMNSELEEKGFLIARGRVPVAYFQERFFGIKAAGD